MTTQDFHRIMKRPGWRKVASTAYNLYRDNKPANVGVGLRGDLARVCVTVAARPKWEETTDERELLRRIQVLELAAK